MSKKRLFILVCLSYFVIFSPTSRTYAKAPLTLWVHPYLPSTEIMTKFSPLATYLSNRCGEPIEVRISKSYKSHIERVGEDRMDLAYLGPASYVKITNTYGKKNILAALEVNGEPCFYGIIITRRDSPIKTLQDLAGKDFAFGDPNSTMGHLVPRYMLSQAGIQVSKLKRYEFLDSHNNVALGVLGGYYDAGSVKEEVYYKYRERGLVMLAKSPPLTEHLFVVNSKLPQTTIAKLRQALVQLKDEAVLTSIKKSATGMVVVKDEDYDILRDILKHFKGIKSN